MYFQHHGAVSSSSPRARSASPRHGEVRHGLQAGGRAELVGLEGRLRPRVAVQEGPELDPPLQLLRREPGPVQAVDLLGHDELLGREGDLVPHRGAAVRAQVGLDGGHVAFALLAARLVVVGLVEWPARAVQAELGRDLVVVRQEVRRPLVLQAGRRRRNARRSTCAPRRYLIRPCPRRAVPGRDVLSVVAEGLEDLGPVFDRIFDHFGFP
ncbi:hypothetical protein PG994_002837 [Apiospora phragmitis]|uniref:Uncharacterized protein n=1 Tax=Apiospora phragmitis TaxID=2905665 RepID=A0ABR1W6B2_9PEZI